MRWKRVGARVVMVASVGAVVWIVAAGAYGVVASPGDGGTGGGVAAFNACIRQTRFLVLVRHQPGRGLIETIKDRTRRALEGEVGAGRATPILGGAAAADGRYVMSTVTPVGRDAYAIEGCWDHVFGIAPGA